MGVLAGEANAAADGGGPGRVIGELGVAAEERNQCVAAHGIEVVGEELAQPPLVDLGETGELQAVRGAHAQFDLSECAARKPKLRRHLRLGQVQLLAGSL